MKKLILFLLMIMSSSLLLADDVDFVKDGIAYKILSLNPAQLEVVAKEGGYEGNIFIPDNVSYENVDFTVTSIGKKAFYWNNITGIILPSKLKIIHEDAFAWCSGIKKLELPKELETIDACAFAWCEMDSLVIPGSIRKLSTYCFQCCNKLEYLELEEGVTIIPKLVFSSCDKINKVVLPSSLTTIEAAAFDNSPVKVVISKRSTTPAITGSYWFSGGRGTHTLYNPFTYSDSNDRPICVLLVPSGAKASYKNITTQDEKAAWPAETIEEYNESSDFSLIGDEFSSNDNNYIVTNAGSTYNVQLIGNTDSDITKLSIPVSVKHKGTQYTINSINSTYYSQNKQIRDVTIYNDLPLEINANTFSSIVYLMGHLYVPKGMVNVYKEAIGWKDFSNIVELPEVLRGDADGDGNVDMDDATFVTNIILGTEEATEAADVNKDGEINMPDVMFIINYTKNGKFPELEKAGVRFGFYEDIPGYSVKINKLNVSGLRVSEFGSVDTTIKESNGNLTYDKPDGSFTNVIFKDANENPQMVVEVDYTLTSDKGTGETFTGKAINNISLQGITQWEPNKNYTFIFKVIPTYLYILDDYDYRNPTFYIENVIVEGQDGSTR